MEFQETVDIVQSFDGSLVLLPDEHSGFPELSWGDAYFYFAPDGLIPERTQPYATIITKNYPDDHASRLDAPGRFRVNIHVGRDEAARLVGPTEVDPAETDAFFAHPLYGASGWVSVVNRWRADGGCGDHAAASGARRGGGTRIPSRGGAVTAWCPHSR
ncbi:DUF6194 family protein [Leifsonia sp. Root227]|uniref:DUF6194 family protein n=1 Tax=Leifsonia sp. Root227 TaxID=1736496 RepID=UPI000AEF7844|nr:DUF6194 family protein [Leifsonia sp. Root227]